MKINFFNLSFCFLGVGEKGICPKEVGKVGSSKQDCREGWWGVYKSRLGGTKSFTGLYIGYYSPPPFSDKILRDWMNFEEKGGGQGC